MSLENALWEEEYVDDAPAATRVAENRGVALLPALPDPGTIFVSGGTDDLVAGIRATALREAQGLDISTERSRKAIASLAAKVGRTKTAIDEAGKRLKKERSKVLAEIDPERKKCWESLESLQKEIRKPLTDWENIDKVRIARHEEQFAAISELFESRHGNTSDQLREKLQAVQEWKERDWEECSQVAKKVLENVEHWLKVHHAAALVAETEKLELDRLRKAAAEQAQKERDERIATEAAERERKRLEAVTAETERKAEERARSEEAARVAAEKRAQEAEAKAATRAELADRQAKEAARLGEIQAKRQAEFAVEQERKRAAEAARAHQIESSRKEEEAARVEAARVADETHRKNVETAMIAGLVAVLRSDVGVWNDYTEAAYSICQAIKRREVPYLRIEY
jgi:hypothetical protein